MSDNQIRNLLHQVQLSHLEDVLGSFDNRFSEDWQKMLSPGEQQRLMFTRILYWKPRFAGMWKGSMGRKMTYIVLVLDEATSAMDANAETHLYSLITEMDIAIISISHHPSIVHYHNKTVTLDGEGGYSVNSTGSSSKHDSPF